jgi:TRAP-type C4-dicarboxylate transport system permease small subunit
MRRILDGLYLLAGYLAAFCLFGVFVLLLIMAVGREFGLNIPAGDDFASWMMAAMSFLGLAHTFKKGEMIWVGLLIERLNGRAKQAAEVFAHGVGFIFLAYFTWAAWTFMHDSWKFNDMSTGTVSVPLWMPQSLLVFGLAVMAIAMLDELIHVLRGNNPTYEKPPPKTTEELLQRVVEGGGV